MDLGVIFLTGLTVGGFTCLALQGGLLASTIASREEEDLKEGTHKKHTLWPTLAFLATKLVAYLLLGAVLGAFGGALALSDSLRSSIQILASVYMILIALNLLEVHPIFRYTVIQPPKFLLRMIKNKSKSKDLFAPAMLGALTIFIPCGTTLAMEAYAISSGSPFLGAAILGTFILGTSPLFLGLGALTATLGDAFKKKFFKIAGVLVLYLGLTSLNGSLILVGSPFTFEVIKDVIPIEVNLGEGTGQISNSKVEIIDGVQVANVDVYPGGYNPTYFQVKSGIPVKMNLTTVGGYGCTSSFVMPELKIKKFLPRIGTESVEFTPTKVGKITWTCGMGMYYGTIDVI